MPVSEQAIEAVLSGLELEEIKLEDVLQSASNAQPDLYSFLFSDSFALLTKDEHELMIFIFSVIWLTLSHKSPLSESLIMSVEDENWKLFDKSGPGNISRKMDVFFEDSEEELLALIEDLLMGDEKQLLTMTGAEVVAVSMKTLIDLLVKNG